MRAIERTEGRKVLLDTEADPCLWDGRKHHPGPNPPNRWISLYVREAPGGAVFYLEHRTRYQGETDYLEAITADQAQAFAEEHFEKMEEEIGLERLKELGLIDLESVE